ncbi:hypothetical protein LC048_17910 [Mesobacillus subterraneus]|uniref:hypothetical protein n=1 Tax=Mesobacillus subterraneus TaxID=285983 RepID=UPI001CFD4058|nr:hypothetical protein [Mesobacillus subterraneus]WLR54302.1 hypothetical protein LC048_17910 [Mesobacillus subterraneus]
MPVIYIDEHPKNGFFERQLPNGKYRYEGYRNAVKYCIDSKVKKTEQEIYEYLDSRSIDYLIAREGYIVDLD